MKTVAARNVLLLLLGLLGIGALFGGSVLLISPSGKLFGMPLSMLEHSPFHNFLVPGIILFTLLGAIPVMLVFTLIKKPASKFAEMFNCYKDMHWAWTYCIYVAFGLLIWLHNGDGHSPCRALVTFALHGYRHCHSFCSAAARG